MENPKPSSKKTKLSSQDLDILQQLTGFSKSMVKLVFYGYRKSDLVSQAIDAYFEMKRTNEERFESEAMNLIDLYKSLRAEAANQHA